MSNGESEDREVRERIASLIHATERSRAPVSDDELQKLKAAASRLDQMLQATADADRQALGSAAARLDQLLADIRTGKDVTKYIKRRPNPQNRDA